MKLYFVPFIGTRHPKTDKELPVDHGMYAVPGGGIASKEAITRWAMYLGHWPIFLQHEAGE